MKIVAAWLFAGMAACLGGAAVPVQESEPSAELADTLAMQRIASERLTVPVNIGGRGPYRFIVDTGSERTVISRELADNLDLGAGPIAIVHSMSEVSRIATVVIPALEVGRRTVARIHAPAIERRTLGADGLLGVDSLHSQRVELDFLRREMTVTPSRDPEEHWPADTIVVTARSRFGHLLLVDASFEGQRVYVIVDTGAQVTVGNNALRRRLERRRRLGALRRIELISVTGGIVSADYTTARRVRIASAEISNLPVAFADVQPFRQLRLLNRPAILLGMDALQMFERASFDFATRQVRLLVPDRSERRPASEVANAN